MKIYCVFSLESPHRGDSYEYTQYTIFNMNKRGTINYPKSAAMAFFPKGLKNEFETAVVNEPSVFEPLKFYCIILKNKKKCLMYEQIINDCSATGNQVSNSFGECTFCCRILILNHNVHSPYEGWSTTN